MLRKNESCDFKLFVAVEARSFRSEVVNSVNYNNMSVPTLLRTRSPLFVHLTNARNMHGQDLPVRANVTGSDFGVGRLSAQKQQMEARGLDVVFTCSWKFV
jgi:hypothetical protein